MKKSVKRPGAQKMTAIIAKLPRKVSEALKPSFDEVDHYARIILRHERRPKSALAACRREAEIQLWTMRALAAAEQVPAAPAVAAKTNVSARRIRRAQAAPIADAIPGGPDFRELALA